MDTFFSTRGRVLIKRAVCNPFGGLGLTGGIVDVGGLSDCLIGIYEGKADDSILDKYSDVRREKFQTVTDPVSTDNVTRLFGQDPEKALETDEFLKMLNRIKDDEKAQVEFMHGPFALSYDFTQHYHTKPTEGAPEKGAVESVAQVTPVGAD